LKNKKIGIVTISLKNGGLERSCANLSKILSGLKFNVHMISLNPGSDYDFCGDYYCVKKGGVGDQNFLKRIISFYNLKRYIEKNKLDYIIDNRIRRSSFKELIYSFYIYRSTKVIYMVHSSKIESFFPRIKWIAKLILSNSYQTVTVSKGIYQDVCKKYNTNKCMTIYNYVAPMKLDIAKYQLHDNYILFLGRIDNKIKNISLLLKSYKRSNLAPKIKLYIVGSGPDSEVITKEIHELGLNKDVIQFPFTPNVNTFISQAKFLVLTSKLEGFGMVLAESLLLGTPVVSVN